MVPVELTEAHVPRLRSLLLSEFELVQFPLFPGYVGVKKHGCAALLEPMPEGRLQVCASPGYLIDGNISALVEQGGEHWFVWKSRRERATQERLRTLQQFEAELRGLLESPTVV